MGEINFLTKEEEEKNGKKDKKSSEKKDRVSPGSFFAVKKDEPPIDAAEEKARIEKSREEVLEMIHTDKKPKKEAGLLKSKDSGGLPKKSWFSGLFGKKNSDAKASKEAKDPKPAIFGGNAKPFSEKSAEASPGAKKSEAPEFSEVKPGKPESGPKDSLVESMMAEIKPEEKTLEDKPFIFNTNTWQNSGVIATNLIDKSDYSFFDSAKKLKYIAVGVFGAIFLSVAAFSALLYWENSELETLKLRKSEIAALEARVKKMETGISDAQVFQGRLVLVEKLLDKHIYWNNFLDFLEEKTLPNVFFKDGLSVNSDGSMNFSAQTDDYESVKNQLIVLSRDQRVSNLNLESIQAFENRTLISEAEVKKLTAFGTELTDEQIYEVEKGVDFTISFELDKGILYKNSPEAAPEGLSGD
jgi:hypothetical protein